MHLKYPFLQGPLIYVPKAPCLMQVSSFLSAVPTAELEPITENYTQSDEVIPFSHVIQRGPSAHAS